ncbi:MAG: class I SAM-dependent methyltransferase [Litoreibacter sp.]|nr:class I SAM-dependent methyltransferase [Litoreibacter sp.]
MLKDLIRKTHRVLVFNRRQDVLAQGLSAFLIGNNDVIDVGTGDGSVARQVKDLMGDITVTGIDVLVRPSTYLEVRQFDGKKIPFEDDSVDAVTFVDVLHHCENPQELLNEAARISRTCVVIKDHLAENWFDHIVLRFMDWVGNAPHGIALPYEYASREIWEARFREAGLEVEKFTTDIKLYPWPFSLVFGRNLHFLVRLRHETGK